jgi:hypothetical protein
MLLFISIFIYADWGACPELAELFDAMSALGTFAPPCPV